MDSSKRNQIAVRAKYFTETAPTESLANADSTSKVWRYSDQDLGQRPKFDCGILTISPYSEFSLSTGVDQAVEKQLERLFVVARGSASCNYRGGSAVEVKNSDCVYLPQGTECTVESTGEELVLAWASALDKTNLAAKEPVQVIKTLSDVTPVTLKIKGLERKIYRIKQTRGFHFAVFKRGAQTYSPLHTHEPPYFEEAFVVLGGKLWVTGLDGQTNELSDFDFAYVPPYGGNLNENRSDATVTYAWIGAPPVNMKEIPVDRQYSKYEDKMSLNKPK